MPYPGLPADHVTCKSRKPGTDLAGRTDQATVNLSAIADTIISSLFLAYFSIICSRSEHKIYKTY